MPGAGCGDYSWGCVAGPHPYAVAGSAASGAGKASAIHQGTVVAKTTRRIPRVAKAVLGTASVGTGTSARRWARWCAADQVVKREVTRIVQWSALDQDYAVGECGIKLMGWKQPRRFVVVREQVRDSKPPVGKKLIEIPEYTFRVWVTSSSAPPEEIWRDYNHRADMENRIAEWKHDLGADRFCPKDFCATDAVFRSILLLFDLLSEFRRASGLPQHKEPGTLRSTAVLMRRGVETRERANHPVAVFRMGRTEEADRTSHQGRPGSLRSFCCRSPLGPR